SRERQNKWVSLAQNYWRDNGFPYPSLSQDDIELEFRRLSAVPADAVLRRRSLYPSTVGLRLANTFQPQIWSVPARNHRLAPVDHFNNDDTLRKLLLRAATFWPNRRCWNGQCLRGMLRIYAGGRVSNFRPAVARAII